MITLTLSCCSCLRYGIKTDVNFACVNRDETDNLDGRIGGYLGGFVQLCINDKFDIQPEILYSIQGTEYKESVGYDGTFKLDYLNIPVNGAS